MNRKLLMSFVFVLALVFNVMAQDRTISGKVTSSEDGSPLPGVSVSVKGSTKGSTTGSDGTFKISVPANATLNFSFVGFKKQSVAVGTKTTVDVTLASDASEIEEVIVTGYGGALSKRDFTGSISKVSGKDIENAPVQSFDRALQGRAAGVQITSANGVPGGQVQVRIRGVGSISAGTTPLYIVDGVQLNSSNASNFTSSNPLNFLNPNDIESIEILKDAAAASIYGSQAANGVILVTTKQGKSGKTTINFNYNYGITEQFKQLDVLNTQEWINVRTEAILNQNRASVPDSPLATAKSSALTGIRLAGTLTDAEISALPTYDWQKESFRKGTLSTYELAIRGGNDKTTFSLSTSYNGIDANLRRVDFERGTLALNLGHKVNSKLSVDSKINLSTSTSNGQFGGPSGGSFLGSAAFSGSLMIPTNPIYNEDGSYFGTPSLGGTAGLLNQNIIQVADLNVIKATINQMVGNVSMTYKITDGLMVKPFIGLDYRLIKGFNFSDPRTADGFNVRGRTQNQYDENINILSNVTLNYNKEFGKNTVGFLVGAEYRSDVNEGVTTVSENLPTPEFKYANSAANPISIGGFWTGNKKSAIFSNIRYEYAGKYLISLVGRYDGSSRFGENNKYAFFPSVSGSWIASEEEFLKTSSLINLLKIRASYGSTGNDQIGNFPSLGLFGGGFAYNGQAGMAPGGLPNPDLKWERNVTLNLGFDAGLWNDRVTVSADIFRRDSEDLLLNQPIPVTNGFTSITKNVGNMRNDGLELEIGFVPLKTKDLVWKTSFNYTLIDNKITKLYDGITPLPNKDSVIALPGDTRFAVGYPAFAIFNTEYGGVNPATGRPFWYDANGNITYRVQSPRDLKFFGSNQSKFFGGWTNNVTYKGLTLDVLVQYDYGRFENNGQNAFLSELGGRTFNTLRSEYEKRWQKPGDITSVPRPYNGNTELNASGNFTGSRMLQDASYIRLKQISLSYDIPKKLTTAMKIQGLQFYVQAFNVATWSKWEGYDAEFINLGNGNNGVIPLSRSYIGGIKLTF
jgi:TonB-dependent starch-binding outer membrane protein SusC